MKLIEPVVTAAIGGALGAAATTLIGLPLVGAAIGAANGAISGSREVYDWSSNKGRAAFVLDSTWALPTTTAGLLAHALGALRGRSAYAAELSRRQNRHVYGRGFQLRAGYATTFGNVITGAGGSGPSCGHVRHRLVTEHEDVHVWQSRWFGPFFPALYGGWMAVGAVIGSVAWLVGRRRATLSRTVETWSYYLNPFEYWAYSRDGSWPPRGMLRGVGPKRPAVAPFRSTGVESMTRSMSRRLAARRRSSNP